MYLVEFGYLTTAAVAQHLKVKIPHERAVKQYEKDLDSGELKRQIEKEI